jgi:hypothetical protein
MTKTTNKSKFSPLAKDVDTILHLMKKALLSFFLSEVTLTPNLLLFFVVVGLGREPTSNDCYNEKRINTT